VTFFFTDIEGSTRLWEQDGDAMREALARHDELVRRLVEAHDGVVFATGGDGFAAAFALAGEAIACAIEVQAAVLAMDLPRVRMGIHTGEAVERDGDYFGPAVNRAARLMAVGHGGQILVSSATRQISGATDLLDLGEHRLRDLSEPERIFQAGPDGLAAEFPPLRTLEVIATNLPVQLTSFVGRVEELDEIEREVRVQRMVTLTGVGGVGKTRLAIQVAAALAAEFADGVWLCELAPADEREALTEVVALALGVAVRPGLTRTESIVEYLRDREALLLVDNCEHLLDAAAEFTTSVLSAAPRVKILATSREGLGVRGEQLWPLRSLRLPDGAGTLVEMVACEAVALFVDRARAVDPSFVLDDKVAPAVAEICRRLDGIPLAIELAAARVGALSPVEIAGLLDERFRVLTGGRRRAVERHQTLRAAVDWSYSLLDDRTRRVFERLGVFAGTFDAAAAQAVAATGALDRVDVVDGLSELVAKSMLIAERTPDGTTRYQLLETLRQYALESLAGTAGVDALRHRHAQHYADVSAQLGPVLATAEEPLAIRQVAQDVDNLRSAIGWALDRTALEERMLAVRIIAPLGVLVSTMRSFGFGDWAERAVDVASQAPGGLRFSALGAAAFAATNRGDIERARTLVEQAFGHEVPDDAPERTEAYVARGVVIGATDLIEASEFLFGSIDDLNRAGDHYAAVTARCTGGIFAALGGDVAHGRAETETAVALAREVRNPTLLSVTLYGYAITRWDVDAAGALAAIEECLEVIATGASPVIHADALEILARLQGSAGDVAEALRTALRAITEAEEVGNRPSVASTEWYIAEVLGLAGIELEVATVLHGFTTRGPMATIFPAVAGPEAEIHERAVAAMRNELGTERFEVLAEQGARFTYEESIKYAKSELARILAALSEQHTS